MLIQMLIERPQMLGRVLNGTPPWVWGLLAGLVLLGLSQGRARTAGLARIAILPVAMIVLAVWGLMSAFRGSPQLGSVLLAWFAAAALSLAATASMAPPAGARYDAVSRMFSLPGSWVPMLLILGIFLTKYIVGVELAMQPALAHDGQYSLVVSAIYGLFSGIFTGRAVRLWRLASRPASAATAQPINA
ncbi:MAG TPA: DUF6622 family protein [Ramlibacter sp.]|jgi:hypothetical protein